MSDGTVLIVAGVLLGFIGGCVGCAEVFFWAGARAARWAYRAGKIDAAREEEPNYIEELLPPGPGVPADRAAEVMRGLAPGREKAAAGGPAEDAPVGNWAAVAAMNTMNTMNTEGGFRRPDEEGRR